MEIFRKVIDGVEVPLVIIGLDGRVLRFTPSAEQIFKLNSGDIGRLMSEVRSSLDVDWTLLLARVINSSRISESEIQDHSGRWLRLQTWPFRGADRCVAGVVISLVDIDNVAERRANESLLRKLTSDLQKAQEAERARISREIHDELGQSLTILKMDLFDLQKDISGSSLIADGKFFEMAKSIDTLIQTVRTIATDLRPKVLAELGLQAAIETLVSEFTERTEVAVNFECSIGSQEPGSEISIALFRIIQEALTNTIRHTKSKSVDICLSKSENSFVLSARDYHVARSISYRSSGNHLGVFGMRERALGLGGSFSIENEGGTVVKVEIPKDRGLSL
jgi:two-component system sensor histidine kinase UhpB